MNLPNLLAPEVWQRPALFYTLEHFGVTVGAITGVLAARGKQVDLFGVIVLALVTAFGGGTLRVHHLSVRIPYGSGLPLQKGDEAIKQLRLAPWLA